MKIKPVGKIFILLIIGVLAFFGVKKYQSSHPAAPPIVKIDSTHIKDSIKIQDSIAASGLPKDTPTTISAQPRAAGNIIKGIEAEHAAKPAHTKPKKKEGERENLDLKNF